MSDRPDYITCISHTHQDKLGKSWCGRDVTGVFHFQNIDHAAYSCLDGDGLSVCPDCLAIIGKAFAQSEDSE